MKLQDLITPTDHRPTLEAEIHEFHNNLFDTYLVEGKTFIETPGDIEELQSIYYLHTPQSTNKSIRDTDLEKLIQVRQSILGLYNLIGRKEANTLGGTFAEIRNKYPNLWQTILVWGWS